MAQLPSVPTWMRSGAPASARTSSSAPSPRNHSLTDYFDGDHQGTPERHPRRLSVTNSPARAAMRTAIMTARALTLHPSGRRNSLHARDSSNNAKQTVDDMNGGGGIGVGVSWLTLLLGTAAGSTPRHRSSSTEATSTSMVSRSPHNRSPSNRRYSYTDGVAHTPVKFVPSLGFLGRPPPAQHRMRNSILTSISPASVLVLLQSITSPNKPLEIKLTPAKPRNPSPAVLMLEDYHEYDEPYGFVPYDDLLNSSMRSIPLAIERATSKPNVSIPKASSMPELGERLGGDTASHGEQSDVESGVHSIHDGNSIWEHEIIQHSPVPMILAQICSNQPLSLAAVRDSESFSLGAGNEQGGSSPFPLPADKLPTLSNWHDSYSSDKSIMQVISPRRGNSRLDMSSSQAPSPAQSPAELSLERSKSSLQYEIASSDLSPIHRDTTVEEIVEQPQTLTIKASSSTTKAASPGDLPEPAAPAHVLQRSPLQVKAYFESLTDGHHCTGNASDSMTDLNLPAAALISCPIFRAEDREVAAGAVPDSPKSECSSRSLPNLRLVDAGVVSLWRRSSPEARALLAAIFGGQPSCESPALDGWMSPMLSPCFPLRRWRIQHQYDIHLHSEVMVSDISMHPQLLHCTGLAAVEISASAMDACASQLESPYSESPVALQSAPSTSGDHLIYDNCGDSEPERIPPSADPTVEQQNQWSSSSSAAAGLVLPAIADGAASTRCLTAVTSDCVESPRTDASFESCAVANETDHADGIVRRPTLTDAAACDMTALLQNIILSPQIEEGNCRTGMLHFDEASPVPRSDEAAAPVLPSTPGGAAPQLDALSRTVASTSAPAISKATVKARALSAGTPARKPSISPRKAPLHLTPSQSARYKSPLPPRPDIKSKSPSALCLVPSKARSIPSPMEERPHSSLPGMDTHLLRMSVARNSRPVGSTLVIPKELSRNIIKKQPIRGGSARKPSPLPSSYPEMNAAASSCEVHVESAQVTPHAFASPSDGKEHSTPHSFSSPRDGKDRSPADVTNSKVTEELASCSSGRHHSHMDCLVSKPRVTLHKRKSITAATPIKGGSKR